MAKAINQSQREAEILDMMSRNGYTREEAEELWDWDNSDEETEETAEAAKNWKAMSRTAHDARTVKTPGQKKEKKPRERTPNMTKRDIIDCLKEAVEFLEGASNVVITNIEKYITFDMNGEKYEINLIQKRKPKEK